MFSLMSLMYSKKSIGPRTEPCGTPDVSNLDYSYINTVLVRSGFAYN